TRASPPSSTRSATTPSRSTSCPTSSASPRCAAASRSSSRSRSSTCASPRSTAGIPLRSACWTSLSGARHWSSAHRGSSRVPRRPAARAPELRRGVPPAGARLHAPPQGEGGHHGLGANQRLARPDLDRETDRIRPLLHRALEPRPRPEDPPPDLLVRFPQPQRVLSDATGAPSAAGWWRTTAVRDGLLGALTLGLAASISLSEATLVVLAAWLAFGRRAAGARRAGWPLAGPLV